MYRNITNYFLRCHVFSRWFSLLTTDIYEYHLQSFSFLSALLLSHHIYPDHYSGGIPQNCSTKVAWLRSPEPLISVGPGPSLCRLRLWSPDKRAVVTLQQSERPSSLSLRRIVPPSVNVQERPTSTHGSQSASLKPHRSYCHPVTKTA